VETGAEAGGVEGGDGRRSLASVWMREKVVGGVLVLVLV
jgi:hypothetical protein